MSIYPRIREIDRDTRLDDDAKTKKAMSKLRRIQIGDVLRIRHNSFEADGTKSSTLFMGTVVYKDNSLVTVRGDHFAESFQWFDLIETLVDHIRT